MYDLELKKSHLPAQNDAESLNITVGELLREVLAKSPTKTALIDILGDGACGSPVHLIRNVFMEAYNSQISIFQSWNISY
tara:strand:- start:123 stop:362 length:240 start_codon:yes stop_codon:yes gene_type:complete